MYKIVVKNSHIEINDYSIGDNTSVERNFSVWNPDYFRYDWLSIHYDQDSRRLYLPRGVDLYWVEKMFNDQCYFDNNYDSYDYIPSCKIKYKPKNEKQVEALSFILSKGKYSSNRRNTQLGLHLYQGSGKTYCTIAASTVMRCRIAVIMYAEDWINQWKNFILEYTDVTPDQVYIIQGTSSIIKILNRDISNYRYFIISTSTIKSYGDSKGWNKVTELFKHLRIGMKAYDEAHYTFDTMSKIDAYTNTRLTLYITGTPFKSNRDESRIYSYYMKNIPGIELFEKEKDSRTNYVRVEYNSKPTPRDISSCTNNHGFDKNKYCDYIIEKDNFYKIIRIFINICYKSDGKNIFYIGKISAINYVYEWIINEYPEIANDIGVYHSQVKENKERMLEKKIILSTLKSLGTARDIKDLKAVFVLADPHSSEVISLQSFGRPRDKNTYYFEAVDTGFSTLRLYANKKSKAINKYALSYSTVSFTQDELDHKEEKILRERRDKNKLLNNLTQEKIIPFTFVDKERK